MTYYTNNNLTIFNFDTQLKIAENNILPFYYDIANKIKLYNLDVFSFLPNIPSNCIDVIFADPPYFLSSGGITCSSGKKVCVDKGDWDKSRSINAIHNFNKKWLIESKRILKNNGSIWVCGTFHNIFSVGFALQELNFKILNNIVWEKQDPPPNLMQKYFTHASEHLIWASKTKRSKHTFNYDTLQDAYNGQPMKSVWRDIWKMPSVNNSEKTFGKHPTQKPEEIVKRAIIASSNVNDLVFDPFCGSGTTGVICKKLNRKFVGIDNDKTWLNIAKNRLESTNILNI
ncbi:MAG: site-specific DNA-methyltransferase [Desulfamplus sp.]|nr:site-specific DNA-methyltransferase [Desulfamplus sp.]